ncbi:ribonuclease D [Aliidiomarina celeris]|uniref:ribonuclease D n=1 Tax=Aliidiomarina celeris TaxID=2249428 RepID=UPI000DE84FA3|nr:ribonuclease D [Aliidiomarina celeris]
MTQGYRLINATKDLVAFCDQAAEFGWLALDTEFVRTKTFYAELGLVQLWSAEQWVLVDPLNGVDLSPLWALLARNDVLTVMHAAGEDLEIIGHYRQFAAQAPARMFDTQIAWAFLHEGNQIGYAGLVEKLCGVTLDKSQSRTDWLARPLSQAQLDYAAADALYLAKMFPQIKQDIEQSPLYAFFQQECAFQIEKRSRVINPDYAWREVGGFAHMKGVQRAIMAELAKWRMTTAQRENIALPFLLKEPVMTDIALRQPSSVHELSKIEGIHPRVLRQRGKDIVAAIERGKAWPEAEWPLAIPRLDDHPAYKKWFKDAKALIAERAKSHNLAPTLLGSRKQINEVFIWSQYTANAVKQEVSQPELLSSWRHEVAGRELEALANSL